MKQSPNFSGQGGVTKKDGAGTGDDENKKPKSTILKEIWEGQTFRAKLAKIALAFGIAELVLWLANTIWFNHHSFSVNANLDFWVKTICIFITAGGILAVSDAVLKTSGRATILAFSLFFFVTVAGYYYPAPYYEDGKPTVYVNSRTGDIYQNAYADIQHDARTNRNYFLHPRSNDTCWNDSPKNVELIDLFHHRPNPNPSYNPPTEVVTYFVSGSPYTFILKAGETLDHWITFQQDRKVVINLSSDNHDYLVIYSATEQYHDAQEFIPNHDPTEFFLKAGNTDQIITMTLSQ